jgi:hypothetical protein
MKQTVNITDFRRAFHDYGREDNFSYEGLEVLFDYLSELEDDTGEELELDVIACCCDYSEELYSDIAQNYNIDLSAADGDEDAELELVKEHLEKHSRVLGTVGKFIVYQTY